jgi:hypothetical protein
MAGSNDFTGQNIQDTYQRVLQLSSSGELADGTGSLVPLLTVTASHAISASHEITFELSSSHAQTTDQIGSFTANAIGQTYDTVANIAQGQIKFTELDNGFDDLILTNLHAQGLPTFSRLNLNGTGGQNDPVLSFTGQTGSISNPHIGYSRGGAMFFHHVEDVDDIAITFIQQGGELAATIDNSGVYRSLISSFDVLTAATSVTATNATKVDVANDIGNAEHPITFIDDTSPDGGYEALKANANIKANPSTGTITATNLVGKVDGGTF